MAISMTPLEVQDILAGAQGECFATIEGNRYQFASVKELDAKMEKSKTEIFVMGRTGALSKPTGWKGTGECTIYYNQSVLRKLMYRYKQTGEDIYFDMQVSNDDASTNRGRQTVILKNCNLDGITLAKIVSGEDPLEEDVSFTFDDWEMPEEFSISNNTL